MDTELAGHLMDLKATTARTDERTEAILTHQEEQAKALEAHEERDRQDFKELHSRVSRVERKQNWMLGVASATVASVMAYFRFFSGNG